MPFIHIRSLPPAVRFDVARAVRGVSSAFARETGIDEQHVTVTWDMLAPHHYASGGATATAQPATSHPVLVELLAPDFHRSEQIESMLTALASAVAHEAGVAPDNVFASFRAARSGEVFDDGAIVRWPPAS